MFGPLGFPEIAFIVILALLIFGPKRLPELGRTLGRGLGEFRKASNELKRTFNAELSLDEDEDRPAVSRRTLKAGEDAEPERPAPRLRPVAAPAVARSAETAAPPDSGDGEPVTAPSDAEAVTGAPAEDPSEPRTES